MPPTPAAPGLSVEPRQRLSAAMPTQCTNRTPASRRVSRQRLPIRRVRRAAIRHRDPATPPTRATAEPARRTAPPLRHSLRDAGLCVNRTLSRGPLSRQRRSANGICATT
jgi:hypothetical protein